jgi:hypothetical protein
MPDLDIFISHSSHDKPVVTLLITLIRSALNLSAERIRCTSVDGFRLPAGISTNDRLREEIHNSRVFVALITPNSLQSTYVLFELGARWGAGKPLLPLLASGAETRHLKEPLSALNSLTCSNAAQLLQFVHELAEILGAQLVSAAVYHESIQALVEESSKPPVFPTITATSVPAASLGHVASDLDPNAAVLLAIWQLDSEQYFQHGYGVETISNRAGMSIPVCKHHLDTLVTQKQVARAEVIGANGGIKYRLTLDGSSYLMKNHIVT